MAEKRANNPPPNNPPPDSLPPGQVPPSSQPPPEDRELETLLREQAPLPLPLALVRRILEEIVPLERVRPLTLLGRVAAAAAVFFAAWFAFAGQAPALADVAPTSRIAAALPETLGPAALRSQATEALATAAEPAHGPQALFFLGSGALLLIAGLGLAIRFHQPAQRDTPGGDHK